VNSIKTLARIRHMQPLCVATLGVLWVCSTTAQTPPKGGEPKPYAVQPPSVPLLKSVPVDPKMTDVNLTLQALSDDAPKAPLDPKNLEGTWMNGFPFIPQLQRTIFWTPIPYNEAGAKVVTQRVQADMAGRPLANQASGCRPAGAFHYYMLNFPIVILQTKNSIFLLSEQYHGLWEVRMNQQHRSKRYNSGDSIGHWDGNTLVIETTHFSEQLYLDMAGSPLSPDAKMTYRLRKINNGQALEIVTTVDDPKYYSEPWSFANRLVWRPDRFLGEYNCELQLADGGEAALGVFK